MYHCDFIKNSKSLIFQGINTLISMGLQLFLFITICSRYFSDVADAIVTRRLSPHLNESIFTMYSYHLCFETVKTNEKRYT